MDSRMEPRTGPKPLSPEPHSHVAPMGGKSLRLAAKDARAATVVGVGEVRIGEGCCVIAGPCSVEGEDQMIQTARAVREAGADLLRGGAFKPRSSPYDFQGLGMEGLRLLRAAGDETGLPIVTEVVDPRDVAWVSEFADVLQIGARNMQNFTLLQEVGRGARPVILKRGMHSTIEEWLLSAEYILAEGNGGVILCERGIRTFERYTRNTLDLSAAAAALERSHLPVIVDPTHATGRPSLIGAMSLAAVAAGAHGLLLEVHRNPVEALSDAEQALTPTQFAALLPKVRALSSFMTALDRAQEATP
jgi:3-deoxy-7-phosphoheptulonate synthase